MIYHTVIFIFTFNSIHSIPFLSFHITKKVHTIILSFKLADIHLFLILPNLDGIRYFLGW